MSDLRTATREIHRLAEQTPFAQALIKGTLSAQHWALYLYNQHSAYAAIESRVKFDIPDMQRSANILRDIAAIDQPGAMILTDAARLYVDHVLTLPEDLLWSHVYVRYMGDLAGGQLIKKLYAKHPHSVLEFNDSTATIAYIRSKVADADRAEAVRCFESVIEHFKQLGQLMQI